MRYLFFIFVFSLTACDGFDTNKSGQDMIYVACICGETVPGVYSKGNTLEEAENNAEEQCTLKNKDVVFDSDSCKGYSLDEWLDFSK